MYEHRRDQSVIYTDRAVTEHRLLLTQISMCCLLPRVLELIATIIVCMVFLSVLKCEATSLNVFSALPASVNRLTRCQLT